MGVAVAASRASRAGAFGVLHRRLPSATGIGRLAAFGWGGRLQRLQRLQAATGIGALAAFENLAPVLGWA
jgi:hypothetical protein